MEFIFKKMKDEGVDFLRANKSGKNLDFIAWNERKFIGDKIELKEMPSEVVKLFTQTCNELNVTVDELYYKLQAMFDARANMGMERIMMAKIRHI